MRRFVWFVAALALMLGVMAVPAAVSADDWSGGSISVYVAIVDPDNTRNSQQYPYDSFQPWLKVPYYGGGAAELWDEEGNPVYDNEDNPMKFSGKSSHTFQGLAEGVYTLHVTNLDQGPFVLYASVHNGSGGVGTGGSSLGGRVASQDSKIVITRAKPSATRYAVLEYKAYGFSLKTDVGSFKNGEKIYDYYPTTSEEEARNWAVENTDPSTNATHVATCNTHSGIYYGESARLYDGMSSLLLPALSAEEKAMGYTFKGWRLAGGDPDQMYTENQVLGYRITQDTVFEAVWDYPTHKVTFKTNRKEGTLSPASGAVGNVYTYAVDFNNQTLAKAAGEHPMTPDVEPKDGYMFVGWYTDPTKDILTTEEIADTVVDDNITFYALFEAVPDTPVVIKGDEDPVQPDTPAAPTDPESEKEFDKKITATDTDGDFVGSTFGHLRARGVSKGKRKVLLKWTDPKLGAAKYVVYGNRCNTKGKKYYYVKIKEFDSNTFRYTPAKIHGKKLKKGTYYKFLVMAVDKNGKVLAISKTVHVTTKGKRGNDKAVKRVKPTKKAGYTLNVGAVKKLKVKEIKGKKKVARHRAVAWESLNPKVATVDKTGNVTAKGAGTCTIFAYAQNGVYTTFQITVK